MPEMGTSGLMSGDGKRGGRIGVRSRAHPRLYRRLPSALFHKREQVSRESRHGRHECLRHIGWAECEKALRARAGLEIAEG